MPRNIGDTAVHALEHKTHSHVVIALVRLTSADDVGVDVGQKYGLSMTSNDRPKCFFLDVLFDSSSSSSFLVVNILISTNARIVYRIMMDMVM